MNHYRISDFILVQYVRNRQGKSLAIINKQTYYVEKKHKTSTTWRCTRGAPCKARFTMSENDEMVKSVLNHDHDPPNAFVRNGVFYRI